MDITTKDGNKKHHSGKVALSTFGSKLTLEGPLKKLDEESKVVQKTISDTKEEKDCLAAAALLLKDNGIKTRIIKKYLPVMNKMLNEHLQSMDFYVNFTLNENFEETIKSRYRDVFSYESFSEGEKARIDISLLLTWKIGRAHV